MIKKSLLLLSLFSLSCTVDSAKKHYLFAEKLWSDKHYAAAIIEFEKVIAKDPKGKLGEQATYRAAVTQFLFLFNYNEALRLFKNYILISEDKETVWNVQLQIGEILYHHLSSYKQAIDHYRTLLSMKSATEKEASEFLFRIAKSYFFLFNFTEAIETFEKLIQKYPKTLNAEKAQYEMGMVYFTQNDEKNYQKAIHQFESFIKKHPQSQLLPDARFGIASCLEELNQLEEAKKAYESLEKSYASSEVIRIKVNRIQQRLIRQGKVHPL